MPPRACLAATRGYTNAGGDSILYAIIKRGIDVIVSLLLLLLVSPLLAVMLLLIRLDTPGRGLFMQWRAGRFGQPFVIYKLRTMRLETPNNVATATLRDPRRYTTPLGRFLRRSSLDELPQLFNVLRGDMSFIGPRPVVLSEHRLLALRRQNGADRVRPGITGLAQVSGRDLLSPEIKAQYDAVYAQRLSAGLDAAILAATVRCVLRGEGLRREKADGA